MAEATNKDAERRALMLETPIHKLVPKMAVPTVVAMVVTAIYNMADTYFVSFLGTSAQAAVGVNLSIDQFIMMAGSMLAIGANSYIARLLGAKKNERADNTLSTAFFTAFAIGVAFAVFGLIYLRPMVEFLGASETAMEYSEQYARYVLYAAPFMATSFVLNQCLRSEGSAFYSMVGMGLGAVLNIGLDPIFIFTLDMGVAGASIATAISKLVGFVILIIPYARRRTVVRLSFRLIKFAKDIVKEVTLMGLPSFFRTGLSIVCLILLNRRAREFSDAVQAGISVVGRIMMIPSFAVLGFGQGFMPVAGYNWGAKRFDRVKQAFRFSQISSLVFAAVFCGTIIVFAEPIIRLFSKVDEEMLAVGKFCLITQCALMPANAWVIIVNMMHSAIGRPAGAIVLGISRQGICFIPMFYILPVLFGVFGLAATQAAADVFAALIAVPFAVNVLRYVNRTAKRELRPPEKGA
ncbi:MAG: MATE family efflux transporter [Oscillospiraceae bacterium]|jgi:putative MATE family efflux protein|nr:MATE family efflux transporter [Oscillospiraceae bacterium]